MAQSILRESFSVLSDIMTTPPISECLWRILLVFLVLTALLPVVIVLDLAFGGRNSIIDGFRAVVFGPIGLALVMAFCYWPLLVEVLAWA